MFDDDEIKLSWYIFGFISNEKKNREMSNVRNADA